jgi:magnesium transporter
MGKFNQVFRLNRNKSHYTEKVGQDPGQLTYIGNKPQKPIQIKLIQYSQDSFLEIDSHSFSDIAKNLDTTKINWIDVEGISDINLIQEIATYFDFHPLMTEDILNSEHLPKSEEYDKHHFFTLKMMKLASNDNKAFVQQEHLSLVLGSYYLISFQDLVEGDVFEGIRFRARSAKGRLRKNASDYLFYALVDTVIDQYFLVMEYFKERIEDLEDEILANPSTNMINKISALKREMTNIRRVIYPIRDAIERIFIEDYDLLDSSTITYFRDVRDHMYHLVSIYDNAKDTIASLMDMYMSNLSINLNNIMKALTTISLFFVPLTFIAGVYGMNFKYMPELNWILGYPFAWGIMLSVIAVMYIYLRRKKWL